MVNSIDSVELELRFYSQGDENDITEFLNLCYGNWGNIEKWKHLYLDQPLFSKLDVTIADVDGKIIGYGGMHGRYLKLNGSDLLVQLLGDGAVNPEYRGMRLHSKLLKERFKRAGDINACLCLGWVLRNSDAYKSDMRVGFIELNQFPTYLRILNYGRVLKAALADLLAKNKRLKNSLLSIEYPIYIKTDEIEFPLINNDYKSNETVPERIEIVLDKRAIKKIYNFRSLNTMQRITLLAGLLILRKMKVSFPSFRAFSMFLKNLSSIAKSF